MNLDNGRMWATIFAPQVLTAATVAKIMALVQKIRN
jgi:hypothetical protein